MGKPLGSFYGPRKHPTKNVGHLAYSVRPMRWCVQLEEDDLHMLVIPEAFYDYAKGRPSPPRLVEIDYGAGCRWRVHAYPFNTDSNVKSRARKYRRWIKGQPKAKGPPPTIVLDNGWYLLVDFLGLTVGDIVVFKEIGRAHV